MAGVCRVSQQSKSSQLAAAACPPTTRGPAPPRASPTPPWVSEQGCVSAGRLVLPCVWECLPATCSSAGAALTPQCSARPPLLASITHPAHAAPSPRLPASGLLTAKHIRRIKDAQGVTDFLAGPGTKVGGCVDGRGRGDCFNVIAAPSQRSAESVTPGLARHPPPASPRPL